MFEIGNQESKTMSIELGLCAEMEEQEIELKKKLSLAKFNLTLHRNRLLLLIGDMNVPKTELKIACRTMDSHMESSMEVMSQLSDIYLRIKQLNKGTKIVNEMGILQDEFHATYETFWESLNLRTNITSSEKSTEWLRNSRKESESKSFRKEEKMEDQPMRQRNGHVAGFCGGPSIGEDLWRQLKRIQLPVFSGDKRVLRNWKAAFMACVDIAPATGEYKLLQLRQCLSSEALSVIENLGHSASAYEVAKERLERRYGGKRRQVALYLEDLESFQKIRPGNAKDLEKFADLLEIAIINLKETVHYNELGDWFLYGKLRTKLTESMLAKYHRWIYETQTPETVESLKTWVFQESTFRTIASETVHGLAGNSEPVQGVMTSPASPTWNGQRTFFGEMIHVDSNRRKNTSCHLCGQSHNIWTCQKFVKKNVPGRWDTAKRFKLCFRCLGDGHVGKACQNSQPCGQNGCPKLHHVLLHVDINRQNKPKHCLLDGFSDTYTRSHNNTCTFETTYFDRNSDSTLQRSTFITEGKNKTQESTQSPRQTQDHFSTEDRCLSNVSDLLTQRCRKSKEDSAVKKPCSVTNDVAVLEHRCRSKDIAVDRGRKYGPNIRRETATTCHEENG